MQQTVTRAFVAIELPATVTEEMGRVQQSLGKTRVARWVAPSAIHLTLKFLGDVPQTQVSDVSCALDVACRSAAPLELGLQGAGCFPGPERPRVVWIGVGGEVAALLRLQRLVDNALARLGFAPEARGFTPHLTVARIRSGVDPGEIRELGQMVGTLTVATVPFRADQVALIRSELRPAGAVYTRLSAANLGQEPDTPRPMRHTAD